MTFPIGSFSFAVISSALDSSSHFSPLYAFAISCTTSCELTTPSSLSFCIIGSICVSAAVISRHISLISVSGFNIGTKKGVFVFDLFFSMFATFIFFGSILLVRRNLLAITPRYFLPSKTTAECCFALFSLPSICEIVSFMSIET